MKRKLIGLGLAAVLVTVGCSKLLRKESRAEVVPLKVERIEEAGFQFLWQAELPRREKVLDVYLLGGRLYLVTDRQRLFAYDALSGINIWRYQSSHEIASRVADDGKNLYIITDRSIIAIDPLEGFKRQEIKLEFPPADTLAVDEYNIYVGSLNGVCYALRKDTGFERWHFTAGAQLSAGPFCYGQTIFFADSKGWLYALSASDGTEKWRYRLSGPAKNPFLPGRESIYVRSEIFNVYSLSPHWQGAAHRQAKWVFGTGGRMEEPWALVAGTLYVPAKPVGLYALDAETGQAKWFVKDGKQFLLLGEKNAYILSSNGRTQVVSAEDGTLRYWIDTRRFDHFVTNALTDILYLVRSGKEILALREAEFRK